MRTAGDLAGQGNDFADAATPLAQAAEHTVLARTGGLRRRACPARTPPASSSSPTRRAASARPRPTVNVAAGLAQLGQRVLVIDLDPQGNASTALGDRAPPRARPSTYDALVEGAPLADVMQPSAPTLPGLWWSRRRSTWPAPRSSWSAWSRARTGCASAIAGHPLVGSAAEVGEDRFDYVLVDCPRRSACSR